MNKPHAGLRPVFLTPVAILLGLAVSLGWGLARNPKETPSARIGNPVPEDAARRLDTPGDPYTRTGADSDGRVAIDRGVYRVPETFVISEDGRLAHNRIDAVTPEISQTTILPLIESLRRGEVGSSDLAGGPQAHSDRERIR